jgi:hypothetical protein
MMVMMAMDERGHIEITGYGEENRRVKRKFRRATANLRHFPL